jgi:hypothetical protein
MKIREFTFEKLSTLMAKLGTNKSIAFFCIKGDSRMKYCLFDPVTNEVFDFDGAAVSHTQYVGIKASLVLDTAYDFGSGLPGAIALKRNGNFILSKAMNKMNNSVADKSTLKVTITAINGRFAGDPKTIKYQVFMPSTVTPTRWILIPGGGGPGAATVVRVP